MTREETIKWLESLKAEIGKSGNRTLWHYAEAIDMAIEALSAEAEEYEDYEHATLVDIKAPLRASAEAVQGWIPCSKRLPNENENVLADDGIDMFVAWYDNGWNSTDHACDPYTYIIAWMPLPKPYKGGEDE